MSFNKDLERRVQEYAQQRGLTLGGRLGHGAHGIVWATKSQPENVASAVKVHRQQPDYERERDAYLRLKEQGVWNVAGHHVPRLLEFNDELWVIEMTVVSRPFLLDFAGAHLDRPPDFSAEVLADWAAEKLDQFGSNWTRVQSVLGLLQGYGVYMLDVNPGNITFAD